MFGQDIEALAPAVAMSVARFVAVEAALFERDFGALAEILEAYRHDRLGAGPAVLVVPRMRHHDELVRNDLAVDAAEPVLATLRIAHVAAPLAARTNVALARGNRVAAR